MSTYFYLVRINILFLLKHFLLFRGTPPSASGWGGSAPVGCLVIICLVWRLGPHGGGHVAYLARVRYAAQLCLRLCWGVVLVIFCSVCACSVHLRVVYRTSYTVVHCRHSLTLCYTILHNDTLSYTMIHYYTLLYTIIHYYTLLYTVLFSLLEGN